MPKGQMVREPLAFDVMPICWQHSMHHMAARISAGRFTADDVSKLLMMARLIQPNNALREFADGIAHPLRDRGHARYLASELDALDRADLLVHGKQPLGDVSKTVPASKSCVAYINNDEIGRELAQLLNLCGAGGIEGGILDDFIVCLCAIAHGEELLADAAGNREVLDMTVWRRQVSLDLKRPGVRQVILLQVNLSGDVYWKGEPVARDMFADFLEYPVLTRRGAGNRLDLVATGEPLIARTG